MDSLRDFWELHKRECLLAAALLGFLLIFFFSGRQPSPADNQLSRSAGRQGQLPHQASHHAGKLLVDIKGAVNKPGVYRLSHGARVAEAVNAAGGLRGDADGNQVNLAKQVTDQQMIYIPMKGEQLRSPAAGNPAANQSSAGNVVNLNTATKEQLTTITGIGDKKADLILAYRQQHGQFQKVEDLKNITGFGDKTIAKIKDQLAV